MKKSTLESIKSDRLIWADPLIKVEWPTLEFRLRGDIVSNVELFTRPT